MRLPAPFLRLPFACDPAPLITEIRALDAGFWRAHPEGHKGNSALPLVALNGNPDDDGVAGPMRSTPALMHCPAIQRILSALKVPIGRTRLMRIEGNAEATMHVDTNYYWQQRVRIHVPVITTPNVRFICGDQTINMQPGEFWIFDTWRMHNVINPEPTERIHLVIDSVGSKEFWAAIEPSRDTAARTVSLTEELAASISFETENFPVVMSPVEQRGFIDWLRADLFHPTQTAFAQAGVMFGLIEQFHRQWEVLWQIHETRASGHAQYQALASKFASEITAFQGQVRLANGSDASHIVRQWLVSPAVSPWLASAYATGGGAAHVDSTDSNKQGLQATSGNEWSLIHNPESTAGRVAAIHNAEFPSTSSHPTLIGERSVKSHAEPRKTRFDRPVFIVAAPRSGSSLLFETLAKSPDFRTVGGEAHAFFERFDALNPAHNGWQSNRVGAELATPKLVAMLESVLLTAAQDRDGKLVPASNAPFRFLEKTPKNALRIPFLKAAFPDARFIYLYREPRDNVSSIIDAWKSGKFVTYPQLPGWSPPQPHRWSLALTEGWREWVNASLGEVAARQWASVNRTILSDLSTIAANDWCAVDYQEFLENTEAVVKRLCAFSEVGWDQDLSAPLPYSRHTLSAPDANKWRRNIDALRAAWMHVEAVAVEARKLVGGVTVKSLDEPPITESSPPSEGAVQTPAPVPSPVTPTRTQTEEHPFSSTPSPNLGNVLQQLRISVAVSTYQSNQVLFLRSRGTQLNTHFVSFPRPMGMVTDGHRLFLGTNAEVIEFRNMPDVGARREDKPDAVFVPRVTHATGEIDIHELGLSKRELWAVNTRFSCLATIDYDHSFVPQWRPPFITGYSTDDRCHLNGLAMVNGHPKFVTALGECDHARGWRDNKAFGGLLMDVDTKQVLIRGLSMPHSPRWYRDKLWFLESGYGALCTLDRRTGEKKTIATLPGFTRGLDFYGPFAFIGLSQVRETASFSGIPITEMDVERTSGLYIVNVETGEAVAWLRFNKSLQEVFAVNVLVGMQWPEILPRDDPMVGSSYALPAAALKDVKAPPPAPQK